MGLMQYPAWPTVGQWQREISRLFDGQLNDASHSAVADWSPPVDIFEYADRFELQAELPGIDPASVEISLDSGVLTLRGERPDVDQANGFQRARQERIAGRFHRRFHLPETADVDKVQASSEFGVLRVVIAKREQAQPRLIKVSS